MDGFFRQPDLLLKLWVLLFLWVYISLGPITRMWTRKLYCDIVKAIFWNQRISLSTEGRAELDFWQQCFDQYNGQPSGQYPS